MGYGLAPQFRGAPRMSLKSFHVASEQQRSRPADRVDPRKSAQSREGASGNVRAKPARVAVIGPPDAGPEGRAERRQGPSLHGRIHLPEPFPGTLQPMLPFGNVAIIQ